MNLYSSCRNEFTLIYSMLDKIAVNPIIANLYVNSINSYETYLNKYRQDTDFVTYTRVGSTAGEHVIIKLCKDVSQILSLPAGESTIQKKKFLLTRLKGEYKNYLDRILRNYERGVRYVS